MDGEARISSESLEVRSASLTERADCFSTDRMQYERCLREGGTAFPTPYRLFLCATLQPVFRSDHFWECVGGDEPE